MNKKRIAGGRDVTSGPAILEYPAALLLLFVHFLELGVNDLFLGLGSAW